MLRRQVGIQGRSKIHTGVIRNVQSTEDGIDCSSRRRWWAEVLLALVRSSRRLIEEGVLSKGTSWMLGVVGVFARLWTRMVLLSSEKGVELNWLRDTRTPLLLLLSPLMATN